MTPFLETIISLIFIFLVFSLITSWIVEFFAGRFQKRGKMLRQFLVHSLNDPFNKNWGLLLYAHPLIEVLHNDIILPKGFTKLFYNTKLDVKRRLPAYIPSDQFAAALIDIVIHHNRTSKFRRDPVTNKQVLVPDVITDKSFADFSKGIDAMKESEVKITLAALARKVNAAQADAISQLSLHVAEWYDNSMERLNGVYKQKIRRWLFMVGLIVAVCFNVNSIVVVDRLYQDPQLRSSVTAAAENYLKQHAAVDSVYAVENVDSLKNRIEDLRRELAPLHLPIGWPMQDSTEFFSKEFGRAVVDGLRTQTSFKNILGWLLTALALSFGAPFWFDALKKAVNMRSVGLKPAATKRTSE
jgi:hypothetical protein